MYFKIYEYICFQENVVNVWTMPLLHRVSQVFHINCSYIWRYFVEWNWLMDGVRRLSLWYHVLTICIIVNQLYLSQELNWYQKVIGVSLIFNFNYWCRGSREISLMEGWGDYTDTTELYLSQELNWYQKVIGVSLIFNFNYWCRGSREISLMEGWGDYTDTTERGIG